MHLSIPKYLITFIFPSMILGSFIPNLLIVILILFLFVNLTKDKSYKKYLNNYFTYFFITFYILIVLSSLFSDDIYFSLESSLFYFRFFFLSIAIWFFTSKNETIISYFIYSSIITILLLAFYGFYQFSFNRIANILDFRISSFFNDEYVLGSFVSRTFLLPISLIIFLQKNQKFSNIKILFITFFIFISVVCIFISGERTAILYSLIIFFLLFFGFKKISILNKIIIFIFSILSSCLFLFIKPELRSRISENFTFEQILNDNFLLFFQDVHRQYYLGAIKIFNDNVITGIGPKMYRIKCNYYNVECSTHPHNSYLQLLSELGILGFTMLAILFLFISFKILKFLFTKIKLYEDNALLFIYIIFFINLFPFVQNGNFFGSWISILYYLPVGFYLHIQSSKFFRSLKN